MSVSICLGNLITRLVVCVFRPLSKCIDYGGESTKFIPLEPRIATGLIGLCGNRSVVRGDISNRCPIGERRACLHADCIELKSGHATERVGQSSIAVPRVITVDGFIADLRLASRFGYGSCRIRTPRRLPFSSISAITSPRELYSTPVRGLSESSPGVASGKTVSVKRPKVS